MTSKTTNQGLAGHHTTKLDLFTKEFQSEDKLRRVIADLFRKMGHTGVRITHGTNEKGKDIVFYSSGPLGEKRLFACVIKNDPITGQAEDFKTGAPTIVHQIQGVINQINAAFSESLADGRGADQRVDSVYVITPYECPIATVDSVKSCLQRGGQIAFICGQELLELFAEHWPEFLWLESNVLLSYLSALRKGLDDDYALANLILRKSYFANTPGGLTDLYVTPAFQRRLNTYVCTAATAPNRDVFWKSLKMSEVEEEARAAKQFARLLETASIWGQEPLSLAAKSMAEEIIELAGKVGEEWESSYQLFAAQFVKDAQKGGSRSDPHGFVSSHLPSDAFFVPHRNEVSLSLNAPDESRGEGE